MNTTLFAILICLITCCLVMLLVYLWAYSIKNAGVVDIFWSFNFSIIAILLYFLADGYQLRKIIICGMVLIWSLRLGIYLLIRVGTHLDVEEGRYKKMREEWGKTANRKLFFFFQAQAISNIYLAIPFFIIAFNKKPGLTLLEYVGVSICAISICGEAIADTQLKQFKNDPNNKGKVCDAGLWNFSRHPNYFFESMIWIGYSLVALNADYGWIGILSPLTIILLLFRVTGIPLTEQQALRSKGDAYKEYQRTTSMFVPWFKKSGIKN
jgi:steroid 5-alpha reductase family enzyme